MAKKYVFYVFLIIIGIFGMIFSKNLSSYEKRKEFIESYGWIIDEKSVIIERVKLPDTFDIIFSSYNEIQKKSGFNLEKYKGKTIKRYTYKIKNHKETGAVVNVFEYKGKTIAADVLSPALGGHLTSIDERTYQNAS